MTTPGRSRIARGTTWGGFAFASFLVAAASGVALAVPFDAHKPYDSIAWVLLTNPAARYYRNVHFLAAQLFLVLTIAHAWEHLSRATERRLSTGMWARVTLSLPIAVFLMLSGFILRGDAEGSQALRIVTTAIAGIPLAGRVMSVLLFGASPGDLQLVYVHHIATATILTWLFTAEHARRLWPRALPLMFVSAGVAAFGLYVSPALHDGLDPLVKGPWYLVGLQELLHWTSTPAPIAAVVVLILVVILLLPRMSDGRAGAMKRALAACLIAYGAVTGFGLWFRGENWTLAWPGQPAPGISLQSPLAAPSADVVRTHEIPTVLGRREGCLFCHRGVRGMSAAHRPEATGCSSCHGGDPFTLDKQIAHRRLILVPGNLQVAARTCGLAQCHPGIVDRVQRSVMTTMSGVVSVDREVFGEAPREASNGQRAHVRALTSSPADTHLRQLCASCHLGNAKSAFGAIGQASRGGGCNACHLKYTPEARSALARYEHDRASGRSLRAEVHPDLSIDIADDHCFGCHSRSGRISTSYEGWMERSPDAGAPRDGRAVRTLDDGRVFERVTADVHFEKGMRCVDCHTAGEVMGDGMAHGRKSGQSRIACEDCHAPGAPAIVTEGGIAPEARRILTLRGTLRSGVRLLATRKGSEAVVNTTVDADGRARLTAKGPGSADLPLLPPAAVCVSGGGHARLSCVSCHTAWAPRCSGCHTRYDPRGTAYDHVAGIDVKGEWIEEGTDYRAEPPTLGVRTIASAGQAREIIDVFAPGMILTIDRHRPITRSDDATFKRLYARVTPHTIVKGSRSCESCHNDPVALGYGRGTLRFDRTAGGGRWTFRPAHAPSAYDRRPADAWIGFLETRSDASSTRADVRPFTAGEQKRILTAGACLTCHRGESAVMRDAIADLTSARRRMSRSCALPTY